MMLAMLGSHLSVAGGLHRALEQARTYGMGCVQIFTGNPRSWPRGKTPAQLIDAEQQSAWQAARRSTGIEQIVSHDSYLINLASPAPAVLKQSIEAFRREMLRCEELGIPWLVTHPGAHMGEGEDAGLRQVAQSLDTLHRELPGLRVVTCLEITAGQGSCLGHRLEHLKQIIDLVSEPQRLAVCLDTAHLLAAGYDLTSAAGAKATLEEVHAVVGLERVKVLHLNDSKVARASRVDRHEHIGKGHVALDAFGVIMRHPQLTQTPKILETPKGKDDAGQDWDTINLNVLQGLAQPAPAKRTSRKTPRKS
jgi:deoxyribonuclease-4